jgi:hypothetical protein
MLPRVRLWLALWLQRPRIAVRLASGLIAEPSGCIRAVPTLHTDPEVFA